MTKFSVPESFRGLDPVQTRVGKPVITPRAMELADSIHYMLQRIRKEGMVACYQCGEEEVVDPSRDIDSGIGKYEWRIFTGPNTQSLTIDVISVGNQNLAAPPEALAPGNLTAKTTTTPTGVEFCYPAETAAPTDICAPSALELWTCQIAVSASTWETVTIEQTGTDGAVRIGSIQVSETPISIVDTAIHAASINQNNYGPGQSIVNTSYDDLAFAVDRLRREHKKCLWSTNKELSSNNLLSAIEDINTKSTTQALKFDIYPSVPLPELIDPCVSVSCEVYGKSTVTGTVRFAFEAGNIDCLVNKTTPTLFTQTGLINRLGESLSLHCGGSDSGTTTIFGAWVNELWESGTYVAPPFATYYCSMETDLSTSWLAFDRSAGSCSYCTGAPSGDTKFITTGSTADVARFHYVSAADRAMLLLEPERWNQVAHSVLIDTIHDEEPDGWSNGYGTAAIDYDVVAGAPDGGLTFRLLKTAVVNRGVYVSDCGLLAGTSYVGHCYASRSVGGAGILQIFGKNPGYAALSLGTDACNWTHFSETDSTTGASGYCDLHGSAFDGIPSEVVRLAHPQVEKGTYATTWIPTHVSAGYRPPETLLVDGAKIPWASGSIAFNWCPEFPSTDTLGTLEDGVAILFAFGDCTKYVSGSCVIYDSADQKIKFRNDGTERVASDALTFTPWSDVYAITVDFGSTGTVLTVDSDEFSDATAWVPPPSNADGYLNSEVPDLLNTTGKGIAGGCYSDLTLVWDG